MKIPGYEVVKQMLDDDQGCITIYKTKDGVREEVLFIIHSDGLMAYSSDVREEVLSVEHQDD